MPRRRRPLLAVPESETNEMTLARWIIAAVSATALLGILIARKDGLIDNRISAVLFGASAVAIVFSGRIETYFRSQHGD